MGSKSRNGLITEETILQLEAIQATLSKAAPA